MTMLATIRNDERVAMTLQLAGACTLYVGLLAGLLVPFAAYFG
jgi:hypothetical protein